MAAVHLNHKGTEYTKENCSEMILFFLSNSLYALRVPVVQYGFRS
jgi:hypothetical protein